MIYFWVLTTLGHWTRLNVGPCHVLMFWMCAYLRAIDLFSLYVLFPHFRPRDGTPENCFFQILSYARVSTYSSIHTKLIKDKRQTPWEHHVIWIIIIIIVIISILLRITNFEVALRIREFGNCTEYFSWSYCHVLITQRICQDHWWRRYGGSQSNRVRAFYHREFVGCTVCLIR